MKTADPPSRYGLRAACTHCPFRTDVEPYLRPERAQEIATGLREGGEFPCHVTTVIEIDSDGEERRVDAAGSRFCAGALSVMLNEDNPNQMMRIAMRFDWFDPAKLASTTRLRTYRSLIDWVRAHITAPTVISDDGEVLEYEHCGVVWDDCVDPAGFMSGGGAVASGDEPSCNPLTDGCSGCGRLVCTGCQSYQWGDPTDQYCVGCQGDDDSDESSDDDD